MSSVRCFGRFCFPRCPQVMTHLEELVMQGRDLGQFVTDFTWYLRNLLLLKTSDDCEDVLDVSSENLIQLQEEAGMVREDTLMRFIRILSDLSNQLRSAASKRVLLEIALIKMCRPETQNDEISVLERVRRLEKQIESGVVVHQAQGGSCGYGEDYQDQDWSRFGVASGGTAGAEAAGILRKCSWYAGRTSGKSSFRGSAESDAELAQHYQCSAGKTV